MTEPILSIRELQVHFPRISGIVIRRERGRIRAVNGVSLDLREGEIIGLVGESGCGKSTLARGILQLVRPTGGEVWYKEQNLLQLRGEALRRVRQDLQIVFQDPYASLNPRMRAGDIVAEPLRNYGLAKGRAAQDIAAGLLERVGLSAEWLTGYPHEFSGGQRQRIAIARALALEPRILFCDEPVSALDVSIQAQVINLIRQLQRELHLTVVFISHDLSVVRHISDRVAVMYLGRIVEIAPAAELYASPGHPYTLALLQAVPIPDPLRERARSKVLLQGDPPSPSEERQGCDFAPRCPLVRDRCRQERPPLLEIGVGRHSACFYHDEVPPPD